MAMINGGASIGRRKGMLIWLTLYYAYEIGAI
jgi:hypothetical protein